MTKQTSLKKNPGPATPAKTAKTSVIKQANHNHKVSKMPRPTQGGSYTVEKSKTED